MFRQNKPKKCKISKKKFWSLNRVAFKKYKTNTCYGLGKNSDLPDSNQRPKDRICIHYSPPLYQLS